MLRSALFASFLVGCGPADPGPRAFVARGEVFVGVVADGAGARVYACDGDGAAPTVSAWFEGDVADEAFALARDDGATVEGTFDGVDGVEGTVTTADGRAIPFAGDPVPVDATDQGLFWSPGTATDGDVVAGWIVWGPDDQRGGLGLSTSGTLFAVPPFPGLGATQVDAGGEAVDLDVVNAIGPFLD